MTLFRKSWNWFDFPSIFAKWIKLFCANRIESFQMKMARMQWCFQTVIIQVVAQFWYYRIWIKCNVWWSFFGIFEPVLHAMNIWSTVKRVVRFVDHWFFFLYNKTCWIFDKIKELIVINQKKNQIQINSRNLSFVCLCYIEW